MCDGRIVHDAVKPRREFALAPERVQVAVNLYETLLHNILRVVYIAADPVGNGECHVLVGFDKVRERRSIARKHLLYALIFVHRSELFLVCIFLLGIPNLLRYEEIAEVSQSKKENDACADNPEPVILSYSQVFRTEKTYDHSNSQ